MSIDASTVDITDVRDVPFNKRRRRLSEGGGVQVDFEMNGHFNALVSMPGGLPNRRDHLQA